MQGIEPWSLLLERSGLPLTYTPLLFVKHRVFNKLGSNLGLFVQSMLLAPFAKLFELNFALNFFLVFVHPIVRSFT